MSKRFLYILVFILLTATAWSSSLPVPFYTARCLTGGDPCLDGINGTYLNDEDRAIVIGASVTYFYKLDADSAAAESSPDVISPDTNAGDKRWIKVSPEGSSGDMQAATYDADDDSKVDAAAGGTDQDTSGWTGWAWVDSGVWKNVADPNADRINYWDDSDGAVQGLAIDADDFTISSDILSLDSQIPHLDAADTISGNWVNTASPWADNEVVDALTIDGGDISSTTISGDLTWSVEQDDIIIGTILAKSGETGIEITDDGATALYYDNTKEAETISGGLKATNSFTIAATTNVNEISDDDTLGSDSATALVTEQAMKAYMDGLVIGAGAGDVVGPGDSVDNEIVRFSSDTGKLVQRAAVTITDAGDIQFSNDTTGLLTSGGEDAIEINNDGSVDLNYNNIEVFKTWISGTLGGIELFSADGSSALGRVYISDAGTLILSNTFHGGPVQIDGENEGGTGKTLFKADPDSASELYHTGIKVFSSAASGIGVYDSSGDDPLATFRDDAGNNLARIGSINENVYVQVYSSGDAAFEHALYGAEDGETVLYFNHSRKIETETDGVKITGRSMATLGWADADAYGGLNAAITALGATKATLVISSAQTLTSSVDLSDVASIELRFVPGGSIDLDDYDLTLGHDNSDATNWSTIDAGPFEIFIYGGTGRVKLEEGACEYALSEWWGANPRDTADDTVGIQAAIEAAEYGVKAVKLLAGTYYRINGDQIEITATAFHLFGESRETTTLYVTANPSGDGAIELNSGEPSARLEDFTIEYNQTDTATAGNMLLIKPAIYVNIVDNRFEIRRMRLSKVYRGIHMKKGTGTQGGGGGSYIEDLQMSSFFRGIDIERALDTVRIDGVHWWPFDLAGNHLTAFYHRDNTCIQVEVCHDLRISNSFFLADSGTVPPCDDGRGNIGLYLDGSSTTTEVNLTDVKFDKSRLICDIDAQIRVANGRFFSGITEGPTIFMSDGNLIMSSCTFDVPTTGTNATTVGFIYIVEAGASMNRFFSVHGSAFNTLDDDIISIYLSETGTGTINVSIVGNYFDRTPSLNMEKDTINCNNSVRGSISFNVQRDAGDPNNDGDFIDVGEDNHISVIGNMGVGCAINIPAAPSELKAANNNPPAS